MATLAANGINLYYESLGDDDAEPILLVPGLGTQLLRWTLPFCQQLTAMGYRVIRFDNRDAGRSTHLTHVPVPDFWAVGRATAAGQRPDVPYTLQDMAADAIGLLDGLRIARAHVVGRSMGGMIAQLMASAYPERIASLTSVMSSTGNPRLPGAAPDVMGLMVQRPPAPAEDEAGFVRHGLAFARRIAGAGFPFDEEAQRALVLEEARIAHDPAAFGRQIAAIAATGDLRPALARIVAPTLVVHGTDDPLVPPDCGRDTAASIPGAELLLVEGMGHDLPSGAYGTVAAAIGRLRR